MTLLAYAYRIIVKQSGNNGLESSARGAEHPAANPAVMPPHNWAELCVALGTNQHELVGNPIRSSGWLPFSFPVVAPAADAGSFLHGTTA